MLETINSIVCLILMAYAMPVATLLGNKGQIMQRLTLFVVECALCLQVTGPWVNWMPVVPLGSVVLNCAALALITVWWRPAWHFVVSVYGPDAHPRRRSTDLQRRQAVVDSRLL